MGEKGSRSPLTKKFPETLATPISETLPNACNVVDIIAKIPADFCNFTPPIFAITPPSSSDFLQICACAASSLPSSLTFKRMTNANDRCPMTNATAVGIFG
jgi:hypothetical protein